MALPPPPPGALALLFPGVCSASLAIFSEANTGEGALPWPSSGLLGVEGVRGFALPELVDAFGARARALKVALKSVTRAAGGVVARARALLEAAGGVVARARALLEAAGGVVARAEEACVRGGGVPAREVLPDLGCCPALACLLDWASLPESGFLPTLVVLPAFFLISLGKVEDCLPDCTISLAKVEDFLPGFLLISLAEVEDFLRPFVGLLDFEDGFAACTVLLDAVETEGALFDFDAVFTLEALPEMRDALDALLLSTDPAKAILRLAAFVPPPFLENPIFTSTMMGLKLLQRVLIYVSATIVYTTIRGMGATSQQAAYPTCLACSSSRGSSVYLFNFQKCI